MQPEQHWSSPGSTLGGRLRRASVIVLALAAAVTTPGTAHEVPANVAVQIYVHPQDGMLRLLVRAPLASMRDLELPLRGPGYLDFDKLGSQAFDAARIWIADYLRLFENDEELPDERIVAVQLSLPSDRSFASYDAALAHIQGPPVDPATEIVPGQLHLDVLLEVPIRSAASRFSLDPRLAHLGVTTLSVVHFVAPDGTERVFQYDSNPGIVRLDPRWYQAVLNFVRLGFDHILDGIDHLLFVLCLVVPLRRMRPLIAVVTSFTVAHSITLIASAMGLAPDALWFPPLIETLIALSIVYMALENIVGARLERRWLIAFGFGLVHGFGFSFALSQSMQFAGSHLLTALLSFNVGVELGQLLVIAIAVPAFNLLFRRVVNERVGGIIVSAILAHSAWHWMAERAAVLREYRFTWPVLDAATAATAMRWLMLLLIVVGVGRAMSGVWSRLGRPNMDGSVRSPAS